MDQTAVDTTSGGGGGFSLSDMFSGVATSIQGIANTASAVIGARAKLQAMQSQSAQPVMYASGSNAARPAQQPAQTPMSGNTMMMVIGAVVLVGGALLLRRG